MRADWVECKLEDVCKINLGQSPPSSTYNTEKIGLPFYQGKAEFGTKYPTPRVWCDSPKKIAERNDILISVRAPVGATNIANERCGIGRGLAALSYLFNDFILYFLKYSESKLDSIGTGTTFKAISGEQLRSFNFPLPPLPEQRAIVKKIEALFSSLDAGIADLKKAQEQLKIYRQAVLKKAFEGENFISAKLKDLASITSSRRIFRDEYVTEGIPFYRTKEVKELSSGLKPSVELFITYERYNDIVANNDIPKIGDILISAVGTIGVSYVIKDNLPFYFKDGNLVWIKNPCINSYYLHYYFENKIRYHNIIDTSGSAYNALTIEKLKDFYVYYPQNSEHQAQIVKEIESRLSVCDAVEQQIKDSLSQAEALRQSILKKAFEGRLLSEEEIKACQQEPDYEPAAVLLEKIKAEKEAKKSIKKSKKVSI